MEQIELTSCYYYYYETVKVTFAFSAHIFASTVLRRMCTFQCFKTVQLLATTNLIKKAFNSLSLFYVPQITDKNIEILKVERLLQLNLIQNNCYKLS